MDERSGNSDFDIDDLSSQAPGEDQSDPYADVDVSELPEWWQRAIDEFQEYGLRPYRPPRFEDDVMKHTVVESLEDDYSVDINFVGINSRYKDDWQIRIDGNLVGSIGRRRSPEGYTVFEMESDEFATFVRDHLKARDR